MSVRRFPVVREAGERLDRSLPLLLPGVSRSAAERLIADGKVLLNGRPAAKNTILKAGDRVTVDCPDGEPPVPRPCPMDLPILYEDGSLLVLNKPAGLVVHPAPGHLQDTLVNGLLHHCGGRLSRIGGDLRPGIVHRLDKDTSGAIVVAKTDAAALSLSEQFRNREALRRYEAIVRGRFRGRPACFTIDAPIGRNPADRRKMTVTGKNAKEAVTDFAVLEEFPGYTYLSCTLKTGRTHQIRVHLSHAGHPVVGDPLYGRDGNAPRRAGLCLYAAELGFRHPVTGERLCFRAPMPPGFASFLQTLRSPASD